MAEVKEQLMWGIHGGRMGEADSLFLQHKVIALGWSKMGDLSKLPADREAFKTRVVEAYPDEKPGAVPVQAGQFYRFIHEMQNGDVVVYPSRIGRQIHIGTVEGPYVFKTDPEPHYPHHRSVRWVKTIARTQFSQGALYEIGSAMAFFQVKNYADEYRAAVEDRPVSTPVSDDGTVALIAEDIEQTSRDFILKRLAQELKGHPLAEFVAHLLSAMGYRTRVSPEGPDAGIDILAHKDELGFEPPIIKVQVKSTEGTVGDPVVSALYGKVAQNEFGLLVTLGSFSSQARNFALGKTNLRLIDGEEFVNLILQHYEQFDSRYKALLPLKRIYVPEPLEEPVE
jgi:restriction system protein